MTSGLKAAEMQDLRNVVADVLREEVQRSLAEFETFAKASLEAHRETTRDFLAKVIEGPYSATDLGALDTALAASSFEKRVSQKPLPQARGDREVALALAVPRDPSVERSSVRTRDSVGSIPTSIEPKKQVLRFSQPTSSSTGETSRAFRGWSFARASCGRSSLDPVASQVATRSQTARDHLRIRAEYAFTGRATRVVRESDMRAAQDGTQGYIMNGLVHFMTSNWFAYSMCAVIFLNAVVIGIQTELEMRSETPRWINTTEHVFLAIYVLEFSMNCIVYGKSVLSNNWFRFDLVIVAIGVSTTWVALPIIQRTSGSNSTSVLEQILILRLLRLFRLVKALRLISYFETLAKLTWGLLNSVNTMASAIAVIFLAIFILSCIGAELITKSDLKYHPVAGLVIEESLSTLPRIFMTLFRFTNDDSVNEIYIPLIESQPWLGIYFLVTLVVISFCLMNLVTAIIVEDVNKRAHADEELVSVRNKRQFRVYKPVIEAVFEELDRANKGALEIKDILLGCGNLQTKIPPALEPVLEPERLADIFEYLDLDQSGSLSLEEFLEGTAYLMSCSVPVETIQTLTILREMRKTMAKVEGNVCTMKQMALRRLAGSVTGSAHPRDPPFEV